MNKTIKIALIIIGAFVIISILGAVLKFCPPPGPWPQPPGCKEKTTILPEEQIEPFFGLKQPKYSGERDAYVFPPSCTLIPDKIGQIICEDYKKGAIIFWKEEACDALPFQGGRDTCKKEREVLKELGNKNIETLRRQNPDWWKKPYLNVYVFGDIRVKTEEMQPTASVWGGGTYWGWRDDEIFFTHAVNMFKIVGHSFVYLGENDLDYMRDQLLKKEGISPADLQNPQYQKIKTDFDYLRDNSAIYQKMKNAMAKDFDNKQVVIGGVFIEGTAKKTEFPEQVDSGARITNVHMNPIVPEYRDYLIDYFKAQVDANADGILIDDMAGLKTSRSFDDYTIQLFNGWLEKNTDRNKMAALGITETKTFNYKEFLKSKGYTKEALVKALDEEPIAVKTGLWEQWRNIPLMLEFRRFLSEENEKAFAEIVTQVMAYAKQKGRTDFIITANNGELAASTAYNVQYLDYLTFEHGYIADNDILKYVTVINLAKLAHAKDKPATNEMLFENENALLKMKTEAALDILKLSAMEGYAAKSSTHYIRWISSEVLTGLRLKSTSSAEVYSKLENRSDMKEVQKAYGFMKKHRDYFRDFVNSNAKVAIIYDNDETVKEWKASLTANHQSSAVKTGDAFYNTGIDYDFINWQQLSQELPDNQYRFVLLPVFSSIEEKNIELLKLARQKGIKIISLGKLPANAENIIDEKSDEGEAVAAALKQSLQTLNLPDKVKSVIYRNNNDEYLVHIFNYDYDLDGFKIKKDVRINPAFFNGKYKYYYASLESPELMELDANNPSIPEIKTYGMLVVKKA